MATRNGARAERSCRRRLQNETQTSEERAARPPTTVGQRRGIAQRRALQVSLVSPLHCSPSERCWTSTKPWKRGTRSGWLRGIPWGWRDEERRLQRTTARCEGWLEEQGWGTGALPTAPRWAFCMTPTPPQLVPSEGSRPPVPPSSSVGPRDAAGSRSSCTKEVSGSSDAWQINVLIALALVSVFRSRCAVIDATFSFMCGVQKARA